ncbi:MAG TPA: hypothetical protein ENH23_06830, partial [candidate division Zixibacteria bacterium]|nr:hypothetical protein [candidate division Zixibacteria bacterium]
MEKIKRYGIGKTVIRISRRIISELDQYIGFSRRLIILQANINNRFPGKKKDKLKSWLDNGILIDKSHDQQFVQFVLNEKQKWAKNYYGWNTDEYANVVFPLLSPFSLRRWVQNNSSKKPDFMV